MVRLKTSFVPLLVLALAMNACQQSSHEQSLNGPWSFRYDPAGVGVAEGWQEQEPAVTLGPWGYAVIIEEQ